MQLTKRICSAPLIFTLFLITTFTYAQDNTLSYSLDSENQNFKIKAAFPDGNELSIRFTRIADWEGKEELNRITNFAVLQYLNLKDSFQNKLEQKSLYLKIPKEESPIALKISKHPHSSSEMIFQNNQYLSLKTNKDTLQIIKDLDLDTIKRFDEEDREFQRQIEYSFLLKDISNIESIAESENFSLAVQQIDSVMNIYKQKWENKNNRKRKLNIDINPKGNNLVILVENPVKFYKNFVPNLGFGLELFNNKVAATSDLGLGYIYSKKGNDGLFVMLNATSYLFYDMQPKNSYSYLSASFEFGIANFSSGFLNNKTSLGIGYFFGNTTKQIEYKIPDMIRMYINFPLTNNLQVGMDMMSNFKTSQKAIDNGSAMAVWGIYLKYMLL